MATRLCDYEGSPVIKGVVRYEKDWYLLDVPKEFQENLISQCLFPLTPNKRPHISIIKNEKPQTNIENWGKEFVGAEFSFRFHDKLHSENGLHVWINCFSEDLCKMREYFGLTTLKENDIYRVNFHMTLGRLKTPGERNLRPQYRLNPQSHVDVETLMQHL
jgi:hypothetical protein